MSLVKILKDEKFNIFFSVILGIGLICILKPVCSGPNCTSYKAPISKDFDKYVYKLGKKCYEFTPEIVKCPPSGAIEAFKECGPQESTEGYEADFFQRRSSPIKRCE